MTQVLPDVLGRVELRAGGGQMDKTDVGWHLQLAPVRSATAPAIVPPANQSLSQGMESQGPRRRNPQPRVAAQAVGPKGTTALDRFSQDLTAKAKSGEMDPILGRDD